MKDVIFSSTLHWSVKTDGHRSCAAPGKRLVHGVSGRPKYCVSVHSEPVQGRSLVMLRILVTESKAEKADIRVSPGDTLRACDVCQAISSSPYASESPTELSHKSKNDG